MFIAESASEFFLIGEYLAKLQAKHNCLVHLLRLLAVCWPSAQRSGLALNLPNIHLYEKNCTHTLSNKPFLIWLLTTPPHLKYVATLPCNLSLMACFADINVSQCSVAKYARCGGMFNIILTANLLRNLSVNKKCKLVRIWQNYGHESVATFLAHPVVFRLLGFRFKKSKIWTIPALMFFGSFKFFSEKL